VHVDYNFHPQTKLHRRMNLLLYLNKDWKPEYEGYLELWDLESNVQLNSIAPLFNRAVILRQTKSPITATRRRSIRRNTLRANRSPFITIQRARWRGDRAGAQYAVQANYRHRRVCENFAGGDSHSKQARRQSK
jgi:hypothetical protein